MFSLSPIKILIIVAVILVVLGPDKLPEVARQVGTAWRSLRTLQSKIESEVRDVVPDLPTGAEIARFARSPVNLLNSLADKVSEPFDLNVSASDLAERADAEAATNNGVFVEPLPAVDHHAIPDPAESEPDESEIPDTEPPPSSPTRAVSSPSPASIVHDPSLN